MKRLLIAAMLLLTLASTTLAQGQNDVSASGTVTAAGSLTLDLNGHGTATITVTGSPWTGSIFFEGTGQGGTYGPIFCVQLTGSLVAGQNVVSGASANAVFQCAVGGFQTIRARRAGGTGNATIAINASLASTVTNAVPQGSTTVVNDVSTPLNVVGPLTDAELRAADVNVNVTNASIPVVCTSGCTPGGSFLDNATFTVGADAINNIGGVRLDAPADVADGKAAATRITPKRGLHVNLRDNSGNEVAPLTDTQLRASNVNVTTPDTTATGNITAADETVEIATNGVGTVAIGVEGTFTGAVIFEGTTDNTNWHTLTGYSADGTANVFVPVTLAPGIWQVSAAGMTKVRARGFTGYSGGTAAIKLVASQAPPAGAQVAVTSQPNLSSEQPSGDPLATSTFVAIGGNAGGTGIMAGMYNTDPFSSSYGLAVRNIPGDTVQKVDVTSLSATDVDIRDLAFATDKVDVSGSAVDVSGSSVSVSSSALPTGAATSANQTNGTQLARITDGTDTADVVAATTAPSYSNPALQVTLRESVKNGSDTTTAAFERGLLNFGKDQFGNTARPLPVVRSGDLFSGQTMPVTDRLVVQVSESAYGNGAQVLSALNASAGTLNYDDNAAGALIFPKNTGSFVGTLTPKLQHINGTEQDTLAYDTVTGQAVSTLTLDRIYYVPGARLYQITAKATAYTSGSVTVYIAPTQKQMAQFTAATIVNGSGAAAVNIQDGGNSITVDGTVGVSGTVTTTDAATTSLDGKFPATAALADATANPSLTKIQTFGSLFNGTTWDRWTSGSTGADGAVGPTTGAANTRGFNFGFNGVGWDRLRSGAAATDSVSPPLTGNLSTQNFLYAFNASSWDRVASGSLASDGAAAIITGNLNTRGFMFGFNGAGYDRIRSGATNADNVSTTTLGALYSAGFNFVWDSGGSNWDRMTQPLTDAQLRASNVNVAVAAALPAGSNIIGNVRIDQTTPGTTNGVQVNNTVTVQQGTATNLKAQAEAYQGGTAVGAANPLQVSLANTGANATAVKVDGTGGSFPVSGTVAVSSAPDPSYTDATGTGIPANVAVIGGSDGIITRALSTTTSGEPNVNLSKVNGIAPSTGSGTATNAIRVELPTNGTGVVGLNAGSNIVGRVGIDQTTPGTTNKVSLGTDVVTTKEQRAATPAVTSVSGSATSVTCLASNANRLGATVYNDSTADLYVKLGATASTTSFTVKVFQDGFFTVPFGYTGVIDCIWSSATGSARVTEVTQ